MTIQTLIQNFSKEKIQSEAEVRSKLIVPLLELLGYPSECRTEEWPVYGWAGGTPLGAKAADFAMFSSADFAEHRNNNAEDIKWVYEHSLLIFEAKKTTEAIKKVGQPMFYAAWTRAIAYVISNGIDFEAYIVDANYTDRLVLACRVSELPEKWGYLEEITYKKVLEKKSACKLYSNDFKCDLYATYCNAVLTKCEEKTRNVIQRDMLEKDKKKAEEKPYEMLCDMKKLVITAEPGAGKTHLLYMLQKEFLKRKADIVPVIIEARYFSRLFSSIEDAVFHEIQPYQNMITIEKIKEDIKLGKFAILIDGYDELEQNTDWFRKLIFDCANQTESCIFVTSRIENYNNEFKGEFEHYKIKPLSDEQINAYLKESTKDMVSIYRQNITKDLLELLRIPLYLNMFVEVVCASEDYAIPKNLAEMFQSFVQNSFGNKLSIPVKVKVQKVLAEYAHETLIEAESEEKLVEILEKHHADIFYPDIKRSGLLDNGNQGPRFYHKLMQEYFAAKAIAEYDEEKLDLWLKNYAKEKAYFEVLGFLTGILSNKERQNQVLDYLEKTDIHLYAKALRQRRNFSSSIEQVDDAYMCDYFSQMYRSYVNLIQVHFKKLQHFFDGYGPRFSDEKNVVCFDGKMDGNSGNIAVQIRMGTKDEAVIRCEMCGSLGMQIKVGDRVVESAVQAYTCRGEFATYWGYHLGMLAYGFDSAREIAFDMVKSQVMNLMKQRRGFDDCISVLLCEYLQKRLKALQRVSDFSEDKERLSLYKSSPDDIFECLQKATSDSYCVIGCGKSVDIKEMMEVCLLLKNLCDNPVDFLDILPDKKWNHQSGGYHSWDLYSDEQLIRKITFDIIKMQEALKKIVEQFFPRMNESAKQQLLNIRIIGYACRKDHNSFSCIYIKVKDGEDTTPIIQMTSSRKNFYPIDSTYGKILQQIGKSKQDVIGSMGSGIEHFFKDDLFHELIYEKMEDALKQLFRE